MVNSFIGLVKVPIFMVLLPIYNNTPVTFMSYFSLAIVLFHKKVCVILWMLSGTGLVFMGFYMVSLYVVQSCNFFYSTVWWG